MSRNSDANSGRPRHTHAEVVRRTRPEVQTRAWSAKGHDEFVLLGSPQTDEWSFFRGAQPNALLIGSEARATAAMARLRPYLRAPLVHWHPSALVEPPHATGTLVTWEVDTLDQLQQALLLTWMDGHAADVQMISIAPCPVFPLLSEGMFLSALYYRLNTVCVALPGSLNMAVDGGSRKKAERTLRSAVGFTIA
jgi:hypothetical protein